MLIEKRNIPNGATIAIWEITESVDDLLSIINFNPFVIEQIYNFGSEKRRLEYLAVRALVYTVCGKDVSIEYHSNGAPFLVNCNYEISITHTGKYAAIIIHPTKKVGIDIERPSDKVLRVKNRFLSQDEINNVNPTAEKTHLTILWAAKEALYKVIGVKNVDFNNEIITQPFTAFQEGEFYAKETCSNEKLTYKLEYNVYPEFVLVSTIKDQL